MSITSKTGPDAQSSQGIGSSLVPYLTPPIAAGISVIPVYRGFEIKTKQQLRPVDTEQQKRDFVSWKSVKEMLKRNSQIASTNAKEALKWSGEATPTSIKEALGKGCKIASIQTQKALMDGCRAAPTISVIVGTQMISQNLIEKGFKAIMKGISGKEDHFALMLVTSMIVGGISAPALAVFNGQTMGRTVKESLRSLSQKQTIAIVTRETSFLFSLRVSKPMSEFMEDRCGKNKAVEYGSTFAAGAIGSLVGHPADTALTLWQKGRNVENLSQLMRGGPVKALTVGGFSICYKTVKELLESNKS